MDKLWPTNQDLIKKSPQSFQVTNEIMCLLRYRYLNNWQSNVPSLPDSLRLMDLQTDQSTYILHPLKYPFFHFRCTYEPPSSWTVCVSGGEAGWTWSVWTGWVVWSLTRIVPSVRTPSLRSRYVRTNPSCRVITNTVVEIVI